MSVNDVIERYNRAAAALASMVDVDDRMNDPEYICDRSPRATVLRAEHRREMLAEFRDASEALHAWSSR